MIDVEPRDKKVAVPSEAATQETSHEASGVQGLIEEAAKANGVSPQEAAAAFEDNGWDVALMKHPLKRKKKH